MSFDEFRQHTYNRQRMPPPLPPPPGSYHSHPPVPHPYYNGNHRSGGSQERFRDSRPQTQQRMMIPPPSRSHPPSSSSTMAPPGSNNKNYVQNRDGDSNKVYRRHHNTYSCNHSVYSRNRSLHRHHPQRNESNSIPRNNHHDQQQQQRHATRRAADDIVRNNTMRKRRRHSSDDDEDHEREEEEEGIVLEEGDRVVAEARKAVEMFEEGSGEERDGNENGSNHHYKRLRNDNDNRSATANLDDRDRKIVPLLPPPPPRHTTTAESNKIRNPVIQRDQYWYESDHRYKSRLNDNDNGNSSATTHLDDKERKIVPPLPPPSPPQAASVRSSKSDNAKHTVESNTNRNPIIQKHEIIDLCSDDDDDDNDKHAAHTDVLPSHDTSKAITATTTTHIVFAIDSSGSMRNKDVTTKNGKITRWEAVFECIDGFLVDQIEQQGGLEKKAIVSILTFDNEATALVQHMPLVGDGRTVRKKLEAARTAQQPRGGTGFAAGLGLANKLCSLSSSGTKLTTEEAQEQNTIVVFLSDGRPGDLQFTPPSSATVPMQTTFRRNKKTYPAAGTHIEEMKERHGDRLALHMICISKEGKSWLEFLAKRYDGTFHEPELDMDDDDDDDVVEMVVKSQETVLQEKHNKALAAGQVYSVMNTTTANDGGSSSMRTTFRSISSSVTAMRGGGSSRLLERQGVIIKQESLMISYDATRMIMDKKNEKILVPPGETPNERKVKVSLHPFAQGGLRNVYRMQQRKAPLQVAKESRHDVGYRERLRFHIETSQCQARADKYARRFKSRKKQRRKTVGELQDVPSIRMLRAEVIRLKDASAKGGFRYLAVESEMTGTYTKYNSNNGYVNSSSCLPCKVAQAYSHFSYEESKQKEIVVDIQGCEYTYTDPQLHSRSKEFGRADRGIPGIQDFFQTHHCNFICQALLLTDRSIEFGGSQQQKIKKEAH